MLKKDWWFVWILINFLSAFGLFLLISWMMTAVKADVSWSTALSSLCGFLVWVFVLIPVIVYKFGRPKYPPIQFKLSDDRLTIVLINIAMFPVSIGIVSVLITTTPLRALFF